jgi:UDP-3-O-[3-hydroxymyristoyl] glucosamine N-acyltransferase
MVTGSVAFAADVNEDGCQDEYAANGACVDVDATVDGTSTVGANASVLEDASVGPEVALGADVFVAARASLAGRVAHLSNPLTVGAGTVIGRGTQIGADHMIGDDVTIGRSVVAGERLTIAANASLGFASQVGDDVTIGAGAVAGNLVTLGDFGTLGDNAVVSRSVTISDGINSGDGASVNGIVGPDVLIAAGSRIEQGARVRRQADIGAGAAIEATARVGRGAVVESGATVYGRVGANATVGAGATVEDGATVARGGELCAGNTLPTGSQVLGDGTWPVEGCVVTNTCQTIKTSNPSAADGVYNIDPDGPGGLAAFDAYCDMTTDGGGWTLLFNLDTSDGANHEYQDVTWWTTNSVEGSPGLATGHKSAAFSTVAGWDEVLMRVHNSGTPYGHAIRPLLPTYADSTFEDIMDAGNNVVFTGTASTITGDVGTIRNPDRPQTLHGDIFMEFSHALKANSTSSWGAAENVNRLSTTLTNTNYSHTFAGLGGRHQNGIGSYGTRYEAAPISAYCDLRNGYGNGTNMISAHASYPYSSSCKNAAFSWIPADTALFVR